MVSLFASLPPNQKNSSDLEKEGIEKLFKIYRAANSQHRSMQDVTPRGG